MNILVVNSTDISGLPPVRNLVTILAEKGNRVTLLTRDSQNIYFPDQHQIRVIRLPENKYHGFFRILNYIQRVRFMRHVVDCEMMNNDILWTTSDYTVRELKGRVFNYKHVMQLMELIEDIPEIPPFNFIQVHLDRYAKRAYKVVVPEYNRAYIQKVWWGLDKMPIVLPNKPADEQIYVNDAPETVQEMIKILKKEKRRIVLYQGIFEIDRNFKPFAETFRALSDEYCFCLLGPDNDYRKQLCEQYPEIIYLGYLSPPYHLLITQYAHIALLPYVPGKCAHHSILNALYCAPNKIYEYAKYGIPMIGSDVPGLTLPFSMYGIGCIYRGGGVEEMKAAIRKIEMEYQKMSDNCRKFYADTDLYKIVDEILSEPYPKSIQV